MWIWILENAIELITTLFVISGGGVALFQWKKGQSLQRAKFVEQIVERLYLDNEMSKTLQRLDYYDDWYNKDFHGSEIEIVVDRHFAYLNYVCYLIRTGHISKSDKGVFLFEFHQIFNSTSACAYLWNFNLNCRAIGAIFPYYELIEFGVKEKFIDRIVLESKVSEEYPQHMNFCSQSSTDKTCEALKTSTCPHTNNNIPQCEYFNYKSAKIAQ